MSVTFKCFSLRYKEITIEFVTLKWNALFSMTEFSDSLNTLVDVLAVKEQYAFKEVRLRGKNKVRDLVRATVFFLKYSDIFQLFKENGR